MYTSAGTDRDGTPPNNSGSPSGNASPPRQATLSELIYQHATRPIPQERRAPAPPEAQHPQFMQAQAAAEPITIFGGGTGLMVTPPTDGGGANTTAYGNMNYSQSGSYMSANNNNNGSPHISRQQHSSWRDVSNVVTTMANDPYNSTTVGGKFLITRTDASGGAGTGGFGGRGGRGEQSVMMGLSRRPSMSHRMLRRPSLAADGFGGVSRTSSFRGGGASFRHNSFAGGGGGGTRSRGSSLMGGGVGGSSSRPATIKHVGMVPPLYVQHGRNDGWGYSQKSGWTPQPHTSSAAVAAAALHQQESMVASAVGPTSQMTLAQSMQPTERIFYFSFEGVSGSSNAANNGGGGGGFNRLSSIGSGGISRVASTMSAVSSSATSGAGGTQSPTQLQTTTLTMSVPPPPPSALVSRGPRIPTPPLPPQRTLMARAPVSRRPAEETASPRRVLGGGGVVGSTSPLPQRNRLASPFRKGRSQSPASPTRAEGLLLASQLSAAAAASAAAEASNQLTADISTRDGQRVVRMDLPKSEYVAERRRHTPAPRINPNPSPHELHDGSSSPLLSPTMAANLYGGGGGGGGSPTGTYSSVNGGGGLGQAASPLQDFGRLAYTPWFGEVWDAVDGDATGNGFDTDGGDNNNAAGNPMGLGSADYARWLGLGATNGKGGAGDANGSGLNFSTTFNSMVFRRRIATAGGGSSTNGSHVFSTASHHNIFSSRSGGNAYQRNLQRYAVDVKGTELDPALSLLTPAEMRYREARQRIKDARRGRRKMASAGPSAVSVYYKMAHEERMQLAAEAQEAEARQQAKQLARRERALEAAGATMAASPSRMMGSGSGGQQKDPLNGNAAASASGGGAANRPSTAGVATLSMALGGPNDPADLAYTLRQLKGIPPPSIADADPSDFVSYFRRQRVDRKQSALVAAAELLADEQRQKRALQSSLFANLQDEQRAYLQRREAQAAADAEAAAAAAARRRGSRRRSSISSTAPPPLTVPMSPLRRDIAAPNSFVADKVRMSGPTRVLFDLNSVGAALEAHQRAHHSSGTSVLNQAMSQQASSSGGGGGRNLEGKNYFFDGPTVFTAGQAADQHTVSNAIYSEFEAKEIDRLLALSTAATMTIGVSSNANKVGGGGSSGAGHPRGGAHPSDMPAGLVESEILVSDTTPGLTGFEKTLCSQLSYFKYRMLMGGRRYGNLAFESGAAAEEAERQFARDELDGSAERMLRRRRRRNSSDDDGSDGSDESLLEDDAELNVRGDGGYNTSANGLALSDIDDDDANVFSGSDDGDDEDAAAAKRYERASAAASQKSTNLLFYRLREQQESFDSLLDELVIDGVDEDEDDDDEAEDQKSGEFLSIESDDDSEEATSRNLASVTDATRPHFGSLAGAADVKKSPTKQRRGSAPFSKTQPAKGEGVVVPPLALHQRKSGGSGPPLDGGSKANNTTSNSNHHNNHRLLSLDSVIEERHVAGWIASAVQAAAAPLTAPPPRPTSAGRSRSQSTMPSRRGSAEGSSPSAQGGRRASSEQHHSDPFAYMNGAVDTSLIPSPYFPPPPPMSRAQLRRVRTETAPFRRLTNGVACRLALRRFEEMYYPQYVAPCLGATNLNALPAAAAASASSSVSQATTAQGKRGPNMTASGVPTILLNGGPSTSSDGPTSSSSAVTGNAGSKDIRRVALPNLLAPASVSSLTGLVMKGGKGPTNINAHRPHYSQQQRSLDAMLKTYDIYAAQFVFPHLRKAPNAADLDDIFAWEEHAAAMADPAQNRGVSFGRGEKSVKPTSGTNARGDVFGSGGAWGNKGSRANSTNANNTTASDVAFNDVMVSYQRYCDVLVENPFAANRIGAPRPPPFLKVLDPAAQHHHHSAVGGGARDTTTTGAAAGLSSISSRRTTGSSPSTSAKNSPRQRTVSPPNTALFAANAGAAGSAASSLAKGCYVYIREERAGDEGRMQRKRAATNSTTGAVRSAEATARREVVRSFLRAYRLWLQYRQQACLGEGIRTAIRERALPQPTASSLLQLQGGGGRAACTTPSRASRRHSINGTPATAHFSPMQPSVHPNSNLVTSANASPPGGRSPSTAALGAPSEDFGGLQQDALLDALSNKASGTAVSTSQLETLRAQRAVLLFKLDQPSTAVSPLSNNGYPSASAGNLLLSPVNPNIGGDTASVSNMDLNATQRSVMSNGSSSSAPRSPRTHHLNHVVPFVVEPFTGSGFNFLGREVPRAWVGGGAETVLPVLSPLSRSRSPSSSPTGGGNGLASRHRSYSREPMPLLRDDERGDLSSLAYKPRSGSQMGAGTTADGGPAVGSPAHASSSPSYYSFSSVYPNLTLASLAEVLTPNLFTAEEMLSHVHNEVRTAESEAEAAFIPPSLAHLAHLPLTNDGINTFGGYGMVGVPTVEAAIVGAQQQQDEWVAFGALPSIVSVEADRAAISRTNSAKGYGVGGGGAGDSPAKRTSTAAVGAAAVLAKLSPADLAAHAASVRLTVVSPHSPLTQRTSANNGLLPLLLASIANTPTMNNGSAGGMVLSSSATSPLSHGLRSPQHQGHPMQPYAAAILTLNGALSVVGGYCPSPMHLLNNMPAEANYAFHAQLALLGAQGQRQFGRLLILMNGLAEEHRKSRQLTTCPPQVGSRYSTVQALQAMLATCGAGPLLPNPWSQHTTVRHASHWVGQRKHQFRMGKAKASIACQTTLQSDKDYRAMRVTLVSYLATGEEPIARQALLNEERSALMRIALAHRMVRKLCEVPAFRISTINTHRRLIRGALEEQANELLTLKAHQHHQRNQSNLAVPHPPPPPAMVAVTPPFSFQGASAAHNTSVVSDSSAGGGGVATALAGLFGGSSADGLPSAPSAALLSAFTVPPPDAPLLASIMLQCGGVDHFARPSLAAKTNLVAHLVVSERSAREDVEALCKAVYERVALQRHIDLQRILAAMDVAEMDFQLARETLELHKMQRQKRLQTSMLAIFDTEDGHEHDDGAATAANTEVN